MTLEPLSVDVFVDAPEELNHSSYVLAGLFDLKHAGLIKRVRVVPILHRRRGEIQVTEDGRIDRTPSRAYKTTFLSLRSGRRRIRIAVDFRDAAFIFPEHALSTVDVLFKRNFDDRLVEILSHRFCTPIEPAGLSFCARSPHEHGRGALIANYLASSILGTVRLDRLVLQRCRREWHLAWQNVKYAAERHPITTSLRRARSSSAQSFIFFQTRTFNRTDDPDANEIHASRAALIRSLRAEFGPRFIGGFIPDPLSMKHYPDCLSPVLADRTSYFNAMSQAAIVIYSRGLVNSAAWKLSEFLALGKCVVAEEVKGRLPSPLTDGETIVKFSSVEDCVTKCHELLVDPQRRESMEDSARRYYERWVDPAAGMHRMLSIAMTIASRVSASPEQLV